MTVKRKAAVRPTHVSIAVPYAEPTTAHRLVATPGTGRGAMTSRTGSPERRLRPTPRGKLRTSPVGVDVCFVVWACLQVHPAISPRIRIRPVSIRSTRIVSLRGISAGYWCALRYAVNTDAGTMPLSLTVTPAWRAQERSSALLGAPVDRAALALRDLPAPAVTPAPLRGFALADRSRGFVVG